MVQEAKKLQTLLKLSNKEANSCFDKMMSAISGKFIVDIISLDDILHERHGEYEKEKLSMRTCIEKYYGEEASTFIQKSI